MAYQFPYAPNSPAGWWFFSFPICHAPFSFVSLLRTYQSYFYPIHGERDNKEKYQLVIKDKNKNNWQDNDIFYISIDDHTLYWIMLIMVYLNIIQSVVRINLRMLDYIDATTKQQRKK